jgi:hypothetical protein
MEPVTVFAVAEQELMVMRVALAAAVKLETVTQNQVLTQAVRAKLEMVMTRKVRAKSPLLRR